MELKLLSEKFMLDWFGCEGRELGCPERFFTSNSADLFGTIKKCAQTLQPCYMSVQPYRAKDTPCAIEALAKYATVDEAMEEIRKLSLESYKLKENSNNNPKKIVDEKELERYLAKGWDVQGVLPSGKILVRKTA
ncbi:MAG: hypothetical protein QHH12_08245 [Candidatus Bathyarchaeota archaeon]|jgi:hypothetical protein|nr:hypothetical protein [Candidatus Bathyarchaeota archaeon A05DMB-3]MDH7607723.1 hypothetical protein [Candidatus Bathyarchaeota archaeon]